MLSRSTNTQSGTLKMSDNNNVNNQKTSAEGLAKGMSEADMEFLMACLQHTTGGAISVSWIFLPSHFTKMRCS